MIECIAPERVPLVWAEAGPQLERACQRFGERSAHDVLCALVTGNAQLWCAHGIAWAVTEVINYPRKRVANVSLVAGRGVRLWANDLREELTRWAKRYQCHEIRLVGRRGWHRLFPDSKQTTVLSQCLSEPSAP